MTYFTFTTTDHELSMREQADMKRVLMAQIVPVTTGAVESPWMRFVPVPSMFMPFVSLGMRPAVVGALTLVLVVGAGGYGYMNSGPTPADSVVAATDTLLAQMNTVALAPMHEASFAGEARLAQSTVAAEDAMLVGTSAGVSSASAPAAVPVEVSEALALIDAALTGSSNVNDVPLARIVASLATLQSAAETHIEAGQNSITDDAVLAFIADKKPLLSLLVSTASESEKLAIHTAASEFILVDVRALDSTQGVFVESYLATRDTEDTADLLDDLSTVKAVASASLPTL
jgi:hypothetical protein